MSTPTTATPTASSSATTITAAAAATWISISARRLVSGVGLRAAALRLRRAADGEATASRLVFAWPAQDVMAVQVKGAGAGQSCACCAPRRKYFGGQLENMVRDHVVTVQTRNHTAASRLEVRGECIVLTQEFREGDYCCKSAVAIGKGEGAGFSTRRRCGWRCSPGTVLIASAATFRPRGGCRGVRAAPTGSGGGERLGCALRETADWWHEFWSRGWVSLHSADGVAQRSRRTTTISST